MNRRTGSSPSGMSHWAADLHRIEPGASRWDAVQILRRDRNARVLFTARLCQRPRPRGVWGTVVGFVVRRAHRWTTERAGVDLPWETEIGPGLAITHGWGLVVSPRARIGANVTLFHGVTIGRKDEISADGQRVVGGAPTIEDGAWIGPGAIVLGPVTVGAASRVAAGAVVAKDVPPGCLVAGNPATVIRRDVPPDVPNAVPL